MPVLILLILFCCLNTVSAQQFRFAQITDIHLNGGAVRTQELMETIHYLNESDSVDFVLITGDVTEDGDRASLQIADSCFRQLRYPYYVAMGNHETKWSDSGCTAWQQIFGYERFYFAHQGVHFLGFNTGPLMRMAYGHVVAQDLVWLRSHLEQIPKGEPVIIVTHYPLLKGDVDNWYEVTDLLRKHNVRLCIGGHYHSTQNHSYDGVPGVLMRSNIREADGHVGYGVYTVRPDSILVAQQPVGAALRPFVSYSMRGDIRDMNGAVLNPNGKANEYPDHSDNERYSNVRREWFLNTDASIYSSPAVYKKQVFVGDDSGVVTSYRLRSGEKLWQFRTGARIVGTPAAANGVLVVGSADGNIYGLKTKDGSLLWQVRADAAVLGATSIRKGVAYIGASDHQMRAIDIRTGQIVWTYSGVDGYIETKPLVTDRHVVFGAWDNCLYSLHIADGTLRWKWRVPKSGTHYSPAAVWPVEAEGKVFVADPQRALTAIDATNGETVWRTFRSKVRETVGLSEDGKRVYSKTMQDSIVCYRTEGTEPVQEWATNVGFGYEHGPSMPLERDGVVYGSTKEGMIFALDARTGSLLWRHFVGSSLVNTILPLSGRRVLFTDTSGHVGMLRWK